MKKEFTKSDTGLVKGIAIILLLAYHLFTNEQWLSELEVVYAPLSKEMLLLICGFGNICVAVFLFLSAYGMTKGFMAVPDTESSLKTYLKRSGLRLGKLTANFVAMYVSVNLLWFGKFNYKGLYGEGYQGILSAVLDGTGFSSLLDTPMLNPTWWYMELAILLIFAVPFLYAAVKKLGSYILAPMLLLPFVFTLEPDVKRYFLVAAAGCVCACEGWFEKIFAWRVHTAFKALAGVLLLAVTVLVRQNYMVYNQFAWVADVPAAMVVIWFGAELLGRIPVLSNVLKFIGRHSMNIFFVHTFFYMMLYRQFIYSFRYAGLILLVLLAISTLYSVILETIKHILLKVIYGLSKR